MDWTKYGYVVASEHRKMVVMALAEGPKTPKQISKETKLYLSHVSHVIKDLLKKKIVECLTPTLKRGKVFSLSDEGKEIAEQLKKLSRYDARRS